MEHLGTEYIETSRLILRRFTIEDAEAMYNNWASSEEVTKYLSWPAHNKVSISQTILEEWTAYYYKKDYYQWAIVLKENGFDPIGCIGVNHHDDAVKLAHIGYCIGQQWWQKGITSEALQCVMDFLFDKVGIQRVESRHDPKNSNSGAVMRKCGMKYEGTLRKADWNNQGICDACYYSLLASER
ncbi:ribosomal-protein-alanine N-acetyltransferase [Lacrimispora sphenoides]|jgi:ribosomal-protein-alanine N-acetyltransferase|uniref:GNAT family N-acetyltransferase n=1 Tax=Lacrimispora sphenoides TaxID=29370 RepID=UPI0008B52A73|nr:GNAT family N-acetyltransferase [Lacrimispora sphenoides]SET54972.1 ribosomal-protein-alanine N-acetyltransferase [Lacrimispora sphenoides]